MKEVVVHIRLSQIFGPVSSLSSAFDYGVGIASNRGPVRKF
jgi:hypothetical protein